MKVIIKEIITEVIIPTAVRVFLSIRRILRDHTPGR